MARARRVAAAPVDVTRFLSYRILALSNTLGRWAAREYPARFGLTLPQWRILSVIATRGAPTAQEIGETLSIDKAWVSRTLAALARRGIVRTRSDPRDRRRMFVGLTARGRALANRVSRASLERQRELVAGLPAGALARFESTLRDLQSRADAMLDRQSGAAAGNAPAVATRAPRSKPTS
ncbi:MAG: MarR family transcriptional regulator [Burkholderiales bacterium]